MWLSGYAARTRPAAAVSTRLSAKALALEDHKGSKAVIVTTGAGDHFNSGFCLGKLLGLNNAMSVLTGVTTSGFYVRTAKSPTISQLAEMMRDLGERPLLPLFGLGQPEHAALGVQRGTLPADRFLTAYFHQPVHDPHSMV